MGYPEGDTVTEYNYPGTGGVPINNMFRKLIFAIYFGEKGYFLHHENQKYQPYALPAQHCRAHQDHHSLFHFG